MNRKESLLVSKSRFLWQAGQLTIEGSGEKTDNAFCATGQGGGVDPSCSKDATDTDVKAEWDKAVKSEPRSSKKKEDTGGLTDEKAKELGFESAAAYRQKIKEVNEGAKRAIPKRRRELEGSALPKNPAKLTVRQAYAAMKSKGLTIGRGSHDLKTKKTTYTLKDDKTGKERIVTTDEIKVMLYAKPKAPEVKELKGLRDKADVNLRMLKEAKVAQDARVKSLKDKLKRSKKR